MEFRTDLHCKQVETAGFNLYFQNSLVNEIFELGNGVTEWNLKGKLKTKLQMVHIHGLNDIYSVEKKKEP